MRAWYNIVCVVVVVIFTWKNRSDLCPVPSLSYSSRHENEFSWSQANPKYGTEKSKGPEKVPNTREKICNKFLKNQIQKHKKQVRAGKPRKGSKAHRSNLEAVSQTQYPIGVPLQVNNSRSCQLRIDSFIEDEWGPQWRPERAYTFPGSTLYTLNCMPISYIYFVLKKMKFRTESYFILFLKINHHPTRCYNFGLRRIHPNGCKFELN